MKEAREQTATTDEWEPGKKRRAKGERRREAVKKARRVMKRGTGRRRYESGWKVRRRRAATRWHEVGKRPREESRRRAECSSGMRQAGASSLGGAGLRARLSLLEKKTPFVSFETVARPRLHQKKEEKVRPERRR